MLIEFSVSNFRSIGERQVLSLSPSVNQKEHSENILSIGDYKSLNMLGIYGANGSGKSNLMNAFFAFTQIVGDSSKISSTDNLRYDPFLLREGWDMRPTAFEMIFVQNGMRYRYGFSHNRTHILDEYLFRKNIGREVKVFQRKLDTIDTTSALKGNLKLIDAAIEATRDNGLFLASLDVLNINEANDIFTFISKAIYIDGTDTGFISSEARLWAAEAMNENAVNQLKRLKLGLIDIEIKTTDSVQGSQLKKNFEILAEHHLYSADGSKSGKTIKWDFLSRESSGTRKALELSSPIMVVLRFGGVLFIDEIEANMHPLLTLDTINLFLDQRTNPSGAQLVFTTHDTNLLSYSNLRRDQIYFAEKNNWESTEIYSLSDFVYINDEGDRAKERPDSDKEKRYIEGRYGAIPVLSRFNLENTVDNG